MLQLTVGWHLPHKPTYQCGAVDVASKLCLRARISRDPAAK
jgi:hypothetical protein